MIAFPNPSQNGAVSDLVVALLEQTSADVLGADLLGRLEAHAAALPNQADRARLFARLAILAGAGYSDLATRLQNRALNSAERVDDPEECVHTMCVVAGLFRRGGRAAGAVEACERAGILARALPAGEGKTRAFLAVAAAVGRIETAARGLAIAGSILDPAAAASSPSAPEAAVSRLDASDLEEVEEIEEFVAPTGASIGHEPATNGHAEPAPQLDSAVPNGEAGQVFQRSHRRRRRH